MIIRRFAIAALALGLSAGVGAQQAAFVSDSPSPLKQSGEIPPNETTFSGEVRISGHFVVLREPGTEGAPNYYRVLLQPDASSRAVLPYDASRGPVSEIWLRDTSNALTLLLSSDQRKALRRADVQRMSGFVTVVITSYRTGIDCDQRGYNAILARVVRPPSDVVVSRVVDQFAGGC